jgi:hypothetical protein
MAKTRKQLQSENETLRAQLAAHGHNTRKALNARVRAALAKVKK